MDPSGLTTTFDLGITLNFVTLRNLAIAAAIAIGVGIVAYRAATALLDVVDTPRVLPKIKSIETINMEQQWEKYLRLRPIPAPSPHPETKPTSTPRPPIIVRTPTPEDDRKAVIIGAGIPSGMDPYVLQQVSYLVEAYNGRVIINDVEDVGFLWDQYFPDLFQHGRAQDLGPQNNADIFAIAPNIGGILKDLTGIAGSIIGANSTLYLAIDGGEFFTTTCQTQLDALQARGYQVRIKEIPYSRSPTFGPEIISSRPIMFTSYYFKYNSSTSQPTQFVQVDR